MNEHSATVEKEVTPAHIMQIGTGFWASKVLLTAVRMGLFTHLASGPLSGEAIQKVLGLHQRSLYDFLDALVALGFLHREGLKEHAVYTNSEDANVFLDRKKPSYVGGILEMCDHRLYKFWESLEEGLKTGRPQNEIKESGTALFEELYKDPARLKEFMSAMRGAQIGPFIAFATNFDFTPYKTLCDIGGASGALCIQVARNNPHMECTTADLPAVQPIAKESIAHFKLEGKIKTVELDFFESPFPKADIITMGNILHDWGLNEKKVLIKKAFDALPSGGAFVVIENIIDNERRSNVMGLLMSLNMLIETESGFDYTAQDFEEWAREAGFSKVYTMPLAGPTSAVIAIK
ncbi:MAG TPA: methyltransferase [Cyclobacteriaceae bacterium]|nr:methyltransferase [Cyclobacteriaceae bacterium]